MPMEVFGVSYWRNRRRFSGARDGSSSAALKTSQLSYGYPLCGDNLVCLLRLCLSLPSWSSLVLRTQNTVIGVSHIKYIVYVYL